MSIGRIYLITVIVGYFLVILFTKTPDFFSGIPAAIYLAVRKPVIDLP